MKVNNILETIGNSPLVRINNLYPAGYEVYVKLEKTNPGGSIKDQDSIDAANKKFSYTFSKTALAYTLNAGSFPIGDYSYAAYVSPAKNYKTKKIKILDFESNIF